MNCPVCGAPGSYRSSPRDDRAASVLRTRRCAVCGANWATVEVPLDRYRELEMLEDRFELRGHIAQVFGRALVEKNGGER